MNFLLKDKVKLAAFFIFLTCASCSRPAGIIFPKDKAGFEGGTEIMFMAVAGGFEGEEIAFVWDFGDGTKASGECLKHSYDRQGEYLVILTLTNEFTETCTETLTLHISSSRFVKMDTSGNELTDNASSWEMVLDRNTDLVWEVKQNRDAVVDYTNIHDADNTYTWYDSDPDTNGGDAGTDGDGTDTEDFIAGLNTEMFGTCENWRMPAYEELLTLRDSLRFNPAINTDYFPETSRWYYWSSTSYVEKMYNYSAFHVDFMGRPSFLRTNHYGYKRLDYHVRGVRDYK